LPGQLLTADQDFEAARCPCGQAYLRERVTDGAQARLYDEDYPLHRGPAQWGLFAPIVAASDARVDARRVQIVRAARALGPGDRVLDLGCGRGAFVRRLHARTGADVLGVDAIRPAAPRGTPWDGATPGARCVRGVLPHLPPEVERHAPFAAVTLWHALEHDPAPRATLEWIRERLAPGGVLVVEVPDGASPLARRLGPAWAGHHTPRHVSLFEPASLRRLCERAGFEVRAQRRHGTLPPYTLVALTVADRLGFRFGAHPAWALFPAWALGLAATWPWLGRPAAEGRGLQLLVATRRR
jgi:2-polyprenyl-3-methyl-5-hydroxy-6-metoxy-1,4-benzoquinol methylase